MGITVVHLRSDDSRAYSLPTTVRPTELGTLSADLHSHIYLLPVGQEMAPPPETEMGGRK